MPASSGSIRPEFDLNMPKYVVRSGVMRALGVFSSSRDESFQRSIEVVVRTDRGLEIGEVLCEATEAAVSQIKEPGHGQILRTMTHEDARERSRLFDQARQEFQTCLRLIAEEKLEMRLVDVEHLFGGERVVVYYLAENRVDFRELVRHLAGEFQTRVEMRQIGVRDEAKAAGRLRRLRQTGLLQHALVGNAAGVDENGQDAKGHARPDQDLGALRAVEMLPAL